jgi:hypothetical protein
LFLILFIVILITIGLGILGYFIFDNYYDNFNGFSYFLIILLICALFIFIFFLIIPFLIDRNENPVLIAKNPDVDKRSGQIPIAKNSSSSNPQIKSYNSQATQSRTTAPTRTLTSTTPANGRLNPSSQTTQSRTTDSSAAVPARALISATPVNRCPNLSPPQKIITQEMAKYFTYSKHLYFDVTIDGHKLRITKNKQTIRGDQFQCFFYALAQLMYGKQDEETLNRIRHEVLVEREGDPKNFYRDTFPKGEMADSRLFPRAAQFCAKKDIIVLFLDLCDKKGLRGNFYFYSSTGLIKQQFSINPDPSDRYLGFNVPNLFYRKLTDPNVYKLLLSGEHFELFDVEEK